MDFKSDEIVNIDIDFSGSDSTRELSLQQEIKKMLHQEALRNIAKAVNLPFSEIIINIDSIVNRIIILYERYQIERNINDIADALNTDQNLHWCLLILVKTSGYSLKTIPKIEKIAARSITVLNAAGVSFSGMDFSNTHISNADLSNSVCHNVKFNNAKLRNVLFSQAWLSGANFEQADCSGVHFGQYPSLASENRLGGVHALCYSPDGQFIAVGSEKGVITIYDACTFEVLHKHNGHESCWINDLIYSPDGRYLASAAYDSTIKIWDATGERLEALRTYEGHSDDVSALSYSPDGCYLASSSHDFTIKIWDATGQSLKALHSYALHSQFLSLSYSPDGLYIACGATDGTVKILDVRRLELIRVHEHDDPVSRKQRIKNLGSFMSFGGSAGNHVYCLDYSPDGKYLASGSSDGTIKVWDVKGHSLDSLYICSVKNSTVFDLRYSPNGNYLISGHENGDIMVWSSIGGQLELLYKYSPTNRIWVLCFSPDGRFLAVGEIDDVKILNFNMNRKLDIPLKRSIKHTAITALSFSPNGRYLAAGSGEIGFVRIWDTNSGMTGTPLYEYRGHDPYKNQDSISCTVLLISYSPSGRYLASLSSSLTDNRPNNSRSMIADIPMTSLSITRGSMGNYTLIIWDASGQRLDALRIFKNFFPQNDMLSFWKSFDANEQPNLYTQGNFKKSNRIVVKRGSDFSHLILEEQKHNSTMRKINVLIPDPMLVEVHSPVDPDYFATGHEDGSILKWHYQFDDSELRLLWKNKATRFMADNLRIEGALGLTKIDIKLLKQYKAIGNPNIGSNIQQEAFLNIETGEQINTVIARNETFQSLVLIEEATVSNLSKLDKIGWTALHWAIEKNNLKVIDKVIQKSTDLIKIKNKDRVTPLLFALHKGENWSSALKLMLESFSNGQQFKMQLELLLENGGELYPWFNHYMINSIKLIEAISQGNLPLAKKSLESGGSVRFRESHYGCTSLIIAGGVGDLEVIKWLLGNGSSANEKNQYGATVIHGAAQKGKLNVLKWLVENKYCRFNERNGDGYTPLEIALSVGEFEVVRWFTRYAKENSETIDGTISSDSIEANLEPKNPLFSNGELLFSMKPNEIALKLRKDTANPKIIVNANYKELVKKSVLFKVHLGASSNGNTAFHWAFLTKQTEKIMILLKEINFEDKEAIKILQMKNKAGKTIIDLFNETEDTLSTEIRQLIDSIGREQCLEDRINERKASKTL